MNTNHKRQDKVIYLLGLLLTGFFLLGVRIYGLDVAPLADYDAVKNYMLAQQLAGFHFSELFYHASPTLNMLNGILFFLTNSYVLLEYVHAAFNVIAILLLGDYVSKKLNWSRLELFSFLFLAGTSLTMVNTSRYLAMESLSLLFFVCFLRAYLETFGQANKKLILPGLLLGLLFTVNYKAFLILPVIFLVECLAYKKDFFQRCSLGLVAFILPFLGYVVLSFLISFVPFQYPAVLYSIMFVPDDHPYRDLTFFNTDVLYYIKYFFWYENPALIVVLLVFPLLYLKKRVFFRKEDQFELILGIIVYAFIFGMSLIQKAPRGLLFIYPLLYVFLILLIKHFTGHRKYVMISITFVVFACHLFSIQKNIYAYAHTSYPALADYVKKHHIKAMASYVGMGAYPFVENEIKEFKVLHQEEELASLRAMGISYLLVDDYYRLACMELTIPEEYELVFEAKEQSLLSPLLALEFSEYSGLRFEESLGIRQDLMSAPVHLKLYRLTDE